MLDGEDVVIARAGKPLVRMVPYVKPRRLGGLADKIPPHELEVLLAPLPEDVIDSFYESDGGALTDEPTKDEAA